MRTPKMLAIIAATGVLCAAANAQDAPTPGNGGPGGVGAQQREQAHERRQSMSVEERKAVRAERDARRAERQMRRDPMSEEDRAKARERRPSMSQHQRDAARARHREPRAERHGGRRTDRF